LICGVWLLVYSQSTVRRQVHNNTSPQAA